MGGVHRDVFLYSTGPAFIADVFAQAAPDAALRDGVLTVTTRLGFAGAPRRRADGRVHVAGQDFEVVFSAAAGGLERLVLGPARIEAAERDGAVEVADRPGA
ncbi:MAG: hypothetical protein P4L73_17550 [Caulobacteraceae bacterium]|nr:hypothetical protein [Caulobacteraceae bacterium]